jgi:alpha-1,2-mannosyltransferase
MATLFFATGAIVGWPFSLALAIPFVLEELFVYGADQVLAETRRSWLLKRWRRLFGSAMAALLILVIIHLSYSI